ncbi:MAG: hypothetical protein ABI539_01685, partial [Acidobacteriota bacterium]
KSMSYWEAVAEFSNQFDGGVDEAKAFLLGLFPGREGSLASSLIEEAVKQRNTDILVRESPLRAVS